MAQAFNLTAQLQLQAPGNTNQVINQIRKQLKPIGVQVNIQNAKNLAQANRSLSSFNKNARDSTKSMNQLNRTLQESARRFSVITIATGSFLALANSFKKSVKEAVAFERELVKISQVTGKSVSQLSSLSNEVTRLSTSLGTSSSDLLNVARTLTQAGFAADDTRKALDVLAKTSLGATFDSIQDTTEGAIALLRQFGNEARSVGSDAAFLEKSLSAISAVSKNFAVESGDLITAIRRTGGVFAAAGGEVNELIALFTSVRATTRESAETIATGLRTIFTRIQRPETITQLRDMGVELQDAQGNFVGAFEAFKRLSQGLKGLDPRSSAFSQIVEDLGGFRQVGKVIPLIQQFTTAQKALSVAQGASGTVAKDAETAQQSLGVQIQKTREQFDALIRKFVDSSAFRSLATGGLELAKAFIRIADSLEPLLPMLITLAGLKLGKGLAPALGSFVGIGKSVSGTGPVTKFATGGIVPGSGNRDTVPAMLTPGEFVIRKSSVNKIGAGNLAAMNAGRQKYATGGAVELSRNSATVQDLLYRGKRNISKKRGVDFDKSKNMFTEDDTFTSDISKNTISPQKRVVDRLEPKTKSALLNSKNTAAQGDAFERYLVESGRMTSPKGFGGNNPFDGKSGNELIEVKRTAVADSILLDKNLRHQLKTGNKLNKSKLSGGSDNIKLPPMTELELNKASVESLAQEYKTAKNKKTKKSDPVEDQIGDANFAFGGLVQKYAAGGIIQAKKAGAAILDPEAKNSYAENVTIDDVKKEFGRAATGAKFARGKDPFSKRFSATKFDVTTSGLNKETSDKFKATLNDSLVAGLDYAGASLGADLGVGAVSVDKSTKDNFINSLRAAQIGDAFENILSTFNNKGVFDSVADPNRPFDFPNGLTSPLADNFDGLPKSFIDAKSSAAAASKDNIRGKILDQIKSELIADGIYNDSPLFKAPRKKALGGIIQKFAEGGVAEAQKAAYIFDFDDTLGTTEAKGFKDFNNPKFIENALATRYASLAKRRASQGDDIHVLTARYGSKGIIQAIQNFMSKNGIPTKSVMAVGGAFPNEREPGKRPGTTRKLGTASKKAKILSKLAKNYSNITFLDDNAENLLKAGQVEGVRAVEAEESKLFKKYAKGGAASDTVPALLTPGEFVFNRDAAQSIGYSNLNRMNKQGVQGYAKGGAVGVQRFAVGGEPKLQPQGGDFGAGIFDPFIDVMAEAEAQVEQNIQTKKEEEQASKKVVEADKKQAATSNKTAQSLQKWQSKLQGVDKVASAAQQFVFVGASIGALFSEFSNASETTKTAVNRTSAELASLVGIVGTVAQVFTALASSGLQKAFELNEAAAAKNTAVTNANSAAESRNTAIVNADTSVEAANTTTIAADTAAEALNTAAVNADTLAESANTAAKAGGALAGFGLLLRSLFNPVTLVIGGLVALVAVISFSKNKIKAENEALAQSAKDLADKFRETGEGLSSTKKALLDVADPSRTQRAFPITPQQQKQIKDLENQRDFIQRTTNVKGRGVPPGAQDLIDNLNKQIERLKLGGFSRELDIALNAFKDLKETASEQDEAFKRLTASVFDAALKFDKTIDLLEKSSQDISVSNISNITSGLENSAFYNRLVGKRDAVTGDTAGSFTSEGELQGYIDDLSTAPEELREDIILVKQNLNQLAEIQSIANKNIERSSSALNDALGRATSRTDVDISAGSTTDVAKAFEQLRRNINLEAAARIANLRILQELISDKSQKEAIDKQISDINAATSERVQKEREYIKEIGDIAEIRSSNQKIQSEIDARQKNIESMERLVETTERLSDLMARSRGDDPASISSINQRNQSRDLQDAIRRNTAALNLQQRGVSGDLVGDVGGLAARRGELVTQQEGIAEDDKEALNANRQAIKAIDEELNRISTDASGIENLFGAIEDNVRLIEKERAARGQVVGVLEEFVVGGQEARQSLAQAAAGVQAAIATGTIQNQSEDQRKATFGLLDKLKDVVLTYDRATGAPMTGEDIKQRLIFDDAIRLGLDPAIAKELATATSVEEKLIQTNQLLGMQIQMLNLTMLQATQAMQDVAAANPPGSPGAPTLNPASGGLIGQSGALYRAKGGSIFKPKGTDTVPAMLTPGEFVIRKSAVDKIGVGALQQINEGGSAVSGFARGGLIPGGSVSYFSDGGMSEKELADSKSDVNKSFKEYIDERISSLKYETKKDLGTSSIDRTIKGKYDGISNQMIFLEGVDNLDFVKDHEALHFMSDLIGNLGSYHDSLNQIPGMDIQRQIEDFYPYIQKGFAEKTGINLPMDMIKSVGKGAKDRSIARRSAQSGRKSMVKDGRRVMSFGALMGGAEDSPELSDLKDAMVGLEEEFAVANALYESDDLSGGLIASLKPEMIGGWGSVMEKSALVAEAIRAFDEDSPEYIDAAIRMSKLVPPNRFAREAMIPVLDIAQKGKSLAASKVKAEESDASATPFGPVGEAKVEKKDSTSTPSSAAEKGTKDKAAKDLFDYIEDPFENLPTQEAPEDLNDLFKPTGKDPFSDLGTTESIDLQKALDEQQQAPDLSLYNLKDYMDKKLKNIKPPKKTKRPPGTSKDIGGTYDYSPDIEDTGQVSSFEDTKGVNYGYLLQDFLADSEKFYGGKLPDSALEYARRAFNKLPNAEQTDPLQMNIYADRAKDIQDLVYSKDEEGKFNNIKGKIGVLLQAYKNDRAKAVEQFSRYGITKGYLENDLDNLLLNNSDLLITNTMEYMDALDDYFGAAVNPYKRSRGFNDPDSSDYGKMEINYDSFLRNGKNRPKAATTGQVETEVGQKTPTAGQQKIEAPSRKPSDKISLKSKTTTQDLKSKQEQQKKPAPTVEILPEEKEFKSLAEANAQADYEAYMSGATSPVTFDDDLGEFGALPQESFGPISPDQMIETPPAQRTEQKPRLETERSKAEEEGIARQKKKDQEELQKRKDRAKAKAQAQAAAQAELQQQAMPGVGLGYSEDAGVLAPGLGSNEDRVLYYPSDTKAEEQEERKFRRTGYTARRRERLTGAKTYTYPDKKTGSKTLSGPPTRDKALFSASERIRAFNAKKYGRGGYGGGFQQPRQNIPPQIQQMMQGLPPQMQQMMMNATPEMMQQIMMQMMLQQMMSQAQRFSDGGVVYASRGMGVPRKKSAYEQASSDPTASQDFWDQLGRQIEKRYAGGGMSQAEFYAGVEADAKIHGRGGPDFSPVVLGSTTRKSFNDIETEADLERIGAVKRGGAAARRRKRLTGKDTYSAAGYGTRSIDPVKKMAKMKDVEKAASDLGIGGIGDFSGGIPSVQDIMSGTASASAFGGVPRSGSVTADSVIAGSPTTPPFTPPANRSTAEDSVASPSDKPAGQTQKKKSGFNMNQMMQMMMIMQMMGQMNNQRQTMNQQNMQMMGNGRQRSRMGSGFLNFLGRGAGYGQQRGGSQMVPFGWIPGSPYNSMLGRGGYNIPRFDKRMMFGNNAMFFANGGAANGGDTVPAMLTPGEFVMNKNAVSKYGTGFMRNLNKGKIQGFNRGGAVQYRQAGGTVAGATGATQMVDFDTSKIEGVFSSFVDNISSTFDNLVSPLNGVVQSLNQIAQSFSGFTMDHKVSVEGLVTLGGLNIESIKNELSTSIGQMVSEEVTKRLDNNNNDFKSA